jgi:hypothetical protein
MELTGGGLLMVKVAPEGQMVEGPVRVGAKVFRSIGVLSIKFFILLICKAEYESLHGL